MCTLMHYVLSILLLSLQSAMGTDLAATVAPNSSSLKSPTYTAPATSDGGFAPPRKTATTIYSGVAAPAAGDGRNSASSGSYSTPDAATAAYSPPSATAVQPYGRYPDAVAAAIAEPPPAIVYAGSDTSAPGVDDYNYHHEIEEPSGFDFVGRALEAVPLFLAVLVAFLLAQVAAPWLAQLLLVAVSLVPIGLGYKAPLINALLLPFNLTLCTTGAPPAVFTGTSITGRELAEGAGLRLSEEQWELISEMAQSGMEALQGNL
jgi:hypothetical protein